MNNMKDNKEEIKNEIYLVLSKVVKECKKDIVSELMSAKDAREYIENTLHKVSAEIFNITDVNSFEYLSVKSCIRSLLMPFINMEELQKLIINPESDVFNYYIEHSKKSSEYLLDNNKKKRIIARLQASLNRLYEETYSEELKEQR